MSRQLPLYLYLCLLPFQQASALPAGLCWADLFLIPAICMLPPTRALWRRPFLLLLAGYLLACGTSVGFSDAPSAHTRELLKVAYLCGVAATVCLSTRTFQDLQCWLEGFLVGATFAAVVSPIAWLQFYILDWKSTPLLTNLGSLPTGSYPRVSGTFDFATMNCNYLIAAFCLAWLYWEQDPERKRLLLPALIVGACLTTLSPGVGGMALAMAWILSGSLLQNKNVMWRFGLCSTAVILALTSLVGAIFGARIFFPSLWANSLGPPARLLCWEQAWKAWQLQPLLGWSGQAPIRVQTLTYSFRDAHNTFLSVGANWGILGVLGFLAILLYCLWPSSQDKAWLRSLQVALCCCLLYDGLTGSYEDARHVWVLVGMLGAIKSLVEDSSSPSP